MYIASLSCNSKKFIFVLVAENDAEEHENMEHLNLGTKIIVGRTSTVMCRNLENYAKVNQTNIYALCHKENIELGCVILT